MSVAIIATAKNSRSHRANVEDVGSAAPPRTIRLYLREVGKRVDATIGGLSGLTELARLGLSLDRDTNRRWLN